VVQDIEDALWLIKTGDSEVGPVSTDEMVAMIEAGEVSARTLVKTLDGLQRWFRVDETALLRADASPPGARETPMSKVLDGFLVVARDGLHFQFPRQRTLSGIEPCRTIRRAVPIPLEGLGAAIDCALAMSPASTVAAINLEQRRP
jgi:hypothetical protein